VTRLKVGVIGCGAIAQLQHLPHMRELEDEFEIAGLCDLSPGLLGFVGDQYGVAPTRRFRDYRELVASDIDAVIVCPNSSHAEPAIAAAEAGKHLFVEKPMCVTVEQAEAMVAAADRAGVILQVGYMKRHSPAYQHARRAIAAMGDTRFIQVNHLHPNNALHLREFPIRRFDDLPASLRDVGLTEHRRLVSQALGLADPGRLTQDVAAAFQHVLGSLIHDIGNLSGVFGPPERVVSTEIWRGGSALTTILAYAGDKRAVCTWIDLPDLQLFEETMEVYGGRERVIVSFPTGFSIGADTVATEYGIDADGHPWQREQRWHDNPFKIELRHFRECVRCGTQPITSGRDAIHDIALVAKIIRAYLDACG